MSAPELAATGIDIFATQQPNRQSQTTMKTHARTLSALAALIFLTGAAGSTSRGQTWQTILDLGPSTYGHDVLANPFPNSPLPIGMFVTADIFSSPGCETV